MRRATRSLIPISALLLASCAQPAENDLSQEIIGLERAALDRWGKGDPQGYLEIMAPEITYFDPSRERRVDGLAAMKDFLVPFTGKIRVDRFDMLGPKVQHHGEIAILTFNLLSYRKQADGTEKVIASWNSTEVYGQVDGRWRIVHNHWSYIKPELKQPVSEES
jgi:ketosteroid isomerase-like protein